MNIFKIKEIKSPKTQNIEAFIINSPKNKELEADISRLNLLDAARTAVKYSTELYIKHPEKKINWLVKDAETKKMILNLALHNMNVKVKHDTSADKVYTTR